jgi:PAS domain S-box-containing protein/putative nucleotidyltransferase with HDIG domain
MTETRASIELILATITDGIVVVDRHGIVLYANQSAEHIFERGSLPGRDLAIPLSPGASHQDINLIRRSGIGWAELRSSLITWEGQAAYVISVRDITERKRAEEVLRKSKDLLQSVVENVPLRIFWKDRDLHYLGCNSRFAQDAGCSSPEELIGKTDFEMGWKDQAELYRADDKAVMESVNPKLGFEEPQTTPDGNTIWLRTSKVPLRDANTQVIGLLGIYEDITARKQSEESLRRANRALKTLSAGNLALVRAKSEDDLLREVVSIIVDKGGHSLAVVHYAEDDPEKTITPKAWAGFGGSQYWATQLSWGDTERGQLPVAKAIRGGTTQICHDITSDRSFDPWREAVQARGYQANIGLPLRGDEGIFGGLSIYSSAANAFDDEEVRLLEELASDLAYGIITLRTRREHELHTKILHESLEQSIQTIADTVEARDPYTAGHQRRVAELATAIAREMGLPEGQINGIHLAAIIHDLGKIHIPAEILSKPGKLSALEYMFIQTHPQDGYDILKNVRFPWPIADIVWQHHERLDGSGYPQGLKGGEILLESRIMAVADVVEAMSSYRPYRSALGVEAALSEIKRGRGSAFDPVVVDACVKIFDENRFTFSSQSS